MSDLDAYQVRATREMQNNIQHRDRVEARLERIESLLVELIGRVAPQTDAKGNEPTNASNQGNS